MRKSLAALILLSSISSWSYLGPTNGSSSGSGSGNGVSSFTAGGVVYSTSGAILPTVAGTSGQILTSGGAGTPTWGAGSVGLGSLNSQAGDTQVFANDTNILITSSNNTHSLGWGTTLSMARGGTGGLGAAVAGGVAYSTASSIIPMIAGTSGQILTSGGASAPTWTSVVPIANGGTNNASLAPVAGGVVYTDASKLNTLAAGTSGQVLKANGTSNPSWVAANTVALSNYVAGGIVYSSASTIVSIAAGTSGQALLSGGAGVPTWGSASGYTPPTTEIVVTTSNGVGSTAGTNKIIRWTNTTVNNGGSDLTYADSSTLGGTITVNTTGLYATSVSCDSKFGSAENHGVGITRNASSLTVDPSLVAAAEMICFNDQYLDSGSGETLASCSAVRQMAATDVLRVHIFQILAPSTAAKCIWSVTRIN